MGENSYKVCVGQPATVCNCECEASPIQCPDGTVLQDCGLGVCTCVAPTPGSNRTFTNTPSATFTPSPTPTPSSTGICIGDCSEDSTVTIDELIRMVGWALNGLGVNELLMCPAASGWCGELGISVDCIIVAVNNALGGCPGPMPTRTPTPPLTPIATCAPPGTPYCSYDCPPSPTPAPGCPSVGGNCMPNPYCYNGEGCIPIDVIPGCCECAGTPIATLTFTPTPTAPPPSPTCLPTPVCPDPPHLPPSCSYSNGCPFLCHCEATIRIPTQTPTPTPTATFPACDQSTPRPDIPCPDEGLPCGGCSLNACRLNGRDGRCDCDFSSKCTCDTEGPTVTETPTCRMVSTPTPTPTANGCVTPNPDSLQYVQDLDCEAPPVRCFDFTAPEDCCWMAASDLTIWSGDSGCGTGRVCVTSTRCTSCSGGCGRYPVFAGGQTVGYVNLKDFPTAGPTPTPTMPPP